MHFTSIQGAIAEQEIITLREKYLKQRKTSTAKGSQENKQELQLIASMR